MLRLRRLHCFLFLYVYSYPYFSLASFYARVLPLRSVSSPKFRNLVALRMKMKERQRFLCLHRRRCLCNRQRQCLLALVRMYRYTISVVRYVETFPLPFRIFIFYNFVATSNVRKKKYCVINSIVKAFYKKKKKLSLLKVNLVAGVTSIPYVHLLRYASLRCTGELLITALLLKARFAGSCAARQPFCRSGILGRGVPLNNCDD